MPWLQDSEEQETLKKLRVFVENLDGQIELLREQVSHADCRKWRKRDWVYVT